MIKAIIFDFGSVIYRTNWEGINRDFIEKFGFEIWLKNKNDKELVRIYEDSNIGKKDLGDFFLKLKPELKGDLDRIIHFYKNSYAKHRIVNEKIMKIIGQLKEGHTLIGFTDVKKEHYEVNQSQGIYKDFKKIFTSFEFGMLKAQREAFERLELELKILNIKPYECIFIDDQEKNVQNAKELGFKTIHYPDFPETKKLLKKLNGMLKASGGN